MTEADEVIDLLVLGAGMAGLSAAAKAASQGASVVLVEKGEAIGGSAAYAGFIWTAPTAEVMHEVNPDGDPALGQRIVDGYDDALAFVRSLGAHVADPVTVLGYGRGCATDMANFLMACERVVRERGGEVLLRSSATSLLIEDGAVAGAKVGDRTIRARHTLLATGGFGGDPDLRAELIGPAARDLPLRANLNSTGDGLRLADERRRGHGHPERRLLRPSDPVEGRLHEPLRVHGPDLLPLRARPPCSTCRGSASATRRSAITSTRSTCSTSPRRGRC